MSHTPFAVFLAASVTFSGPAIGLPAVPSHVEAAQEKSADVSGDWALTVETGQGSGTPGLTLKQDGEKLTGTYQSQVFGEQPITGSIKGNEFTFAFSSTIEGTSFAVTFTGTVEKDTMRGKVNLGDVAEGTFTGKKK